MPVHSLPQSPGEPAQDTATSLSLKPSKGPPGTKVTAQGEGYCESVTLSWDDGSDLATGDADQDGTISVTFTVPEDAKPGDHRITSASPCGKASDGFRVVNVEPTPTPTPTTPTPRFKPPPTPTPTPTPTPPPGSDLEQVDQIIKRELQPGVILYNPPERMRVDDPVRVEVRISRAFSEGIRQGLRGRGEPRVEGLLVGTFMRAQLQGSAFDITPIGSDVQPVLATGFTEWRWDVRPTVSGIHPLYLVVTVVHDGTTLEEPPPFERRIDVAVNPSYWLKSNWEKLLGALAGVVGLAEAYRRLRHKGKGEQPAA
ncbi:MAG: hypothetical protein ACRDZ4_19275 [Egibacteraceae bacterium]